MSSGKSLVIFSPYREGGGTPFDSLWYSQEAMAEAGMAVDIQCTQDPKAGLAALDNAERVLFDGQSSLAIYGGWRLVWEVLRRQLPVAIYWHETDWYFRQWPLNRKRPNVWPPHRFLRYRLRYMPLYWLLRSPRTVHFHVCDYGKRMMADTYGYDGDRIHMLKNITGGYQAVLDAPLGTTTQPYRVVGLGKVDARKRPDLFIKAARYVVDRQPEAQFYFIGRFSKAPYDEGTIAQQISAHGLGDHVYFVGEQRPPFPLLSTGQVFLHTAEDDPSPKVVMEAMGLGKPIVSFRVGGIPEIPPTDEGMVPFGEVEALGEAILQAFHRNSPEEQAQRRAHFAKNYTPPAFAQRMKTALEWWKTK